MKLAITLSILLGASSLFATSLVQKAKDSGLEAIPAQKAQLMKLIDDPKDPITKEKVDLGKNYTLIQDFQKVELFHVIHVIT